MTRLHLLQRRVETTGHPLNPFLIIRNCGVRGLGVFPAGECSMAFSMSKNPAAWRSRRARRLAASVSTGRCKRRSCTSAFTSVLVFAAASSIARTCALLTTHTFRLRLVDTWDGSVGGVSVDGGTTFAINVSKPLTSALSASGRLCWNSDCCHCRRVETMQFSS